MQVIKGSTFEQSQCNNEELFNNFYNLLNGDNEVIIDRFIYSNLVYAYLYNDYSILNDKQIEQLEIMMYERDVVIIYLFADTETLIKRMSVRGDDYVKTNMIPAINEKYEQVMKLSNMQHLNFDTSVYSSNEIVEMITYSLDY